MLKIDGALLTKRTDSRPDEAIVNMFVAFGHRLGLTIIAQGTESAVQLQALRCSEVDYAQGILSAASTSNSRCGPPSPPRRAPGQHRAANRAAESHHLSRQGTTPRPSLRASADERGRDARAPNDLSTCSPPSTTRSPEH